jgi:signal transduction histidine kinase
VGTAPLQQAAAIDSLRHLALRHAEPVAAAVLVLTVGAAAAALVLDRTSPPGAVEPFALVYTACQLLPFGVVGAVLVARRPDLPFGWLLALGALPLVLVVAFAAPSAVVFATGHGSVLAVWGVALGGLAWVPAAAQGLVNVRFPSGRPSGRAGRMLDRLLVGGIVVVAVGGLLSGFPERSSLVRGVSRPHIGTPLESVADALVAGVPVIILLGVLAGLGVVVRWLRASGLERQQLRWRAAGVVAELALFPFVVAETTPAWLLDVAPFVFVATLVVPVLRYDLWAVDSIVRRSAGYTMASPGSVLANLCRASAEMLRLPYVAVRTAGGVLGAHGTPTDRVRTWPVVHEGERVGDLVAAAPHGRRTVPEQDAAVLGTVAELVGGLVRAQTLTRDLQDARRRLVTAREEERRRLRRDLHDGLGPLLTGLGLNLAAASAHLGRDTARSAALLATAQEASGEVIASLREVVDGLRPPALDDLGFAAALRLRLEQITRAAGLALDLQVPDGLSLPAAIEVAAFRTAVEATTNAVRHSRASRVQVQVDQDADGLSVTVTDDGPPTPPWTFGVGLNGMRERAEEVGGRLEAGPGATGGRVRVHFPVDGGGA